VASPQDPAAYSNLSTPKATSWRHLRRRNDCAGKTGVARQALCSRLRFQALWGPSGLNGTNAFGWWLLWPHGWAGLSLARRQAARARQLWEKGGLYACDENPASPSRQLMRSFEGGLADARRQAAEDCWRESKRSSARVP